MPREISPNNRLESQHNGYVVASAEAPITRAQFKTYFSQEIPPTTPIREHYDISQVYFEHDTPIAKFDVLDGNIFFTDSDGRFYYLDQNHQPHILNNGDKPTHTFTIDPQTKEIISAEGNSIVSRQLDNNGTLSKRTLKTIKPPEAMLRDLGWGPISAIELTPDKIYYLLSLRKRIHSLDRNYNQEPELISTDPNLLRSNSFVIFPDGKTVIGGLGSKLSLVDTTRPMSEEEIKEDKDRAEDNKEKMGRKPDIYLEGVSSSRVLRKLSENIIFSGSALGSIHRWSIDAPDKPILVGRHSGSITGILVSPKSENTNERVVSSDNNGEIHLRQATNAKCEEYQETLIAKLGDSVRGILFDKNGNITCAAGKKILQLT